MGGVGSLTTRAVDLVDGGIGMWVEFEGDERALAGLAVVAHGLATTAATAVLNFSGDQSGGIRRVSVRGWRWQHPHLGGALAAALGELLVGERAVAFTFRLHGGTLYSFGFGGV
eukprot:SAG22_NODE_816_length_7028_cov_32.309280_3_plen_114_part_00